VSNTTVFAIVAQLASLRLFLLAVAILDLEYHQINIKTAFLNAIKTGEKVYIKQPQGFKKGNDVCELLRALYGLRESPTLWYHTFVTVLEEMGFILLMKEYYIFKNSDGSLILLYVDDLLITAISLDRISAIKLAIHARFDIKDMKEVRSFLGFQIYRDRPLRRIYIT